MQAYLSKSGDAWTGSAELDLRLASLLGSGRHGMVFLCSQRIGSNTRNIALKVPAHPGALVREAGSLARFSHQHILRMYGAPLSNGALILEHCDGGSLALRFESGPIAIDELVQLINPICEALDYVHESGWIHGDVSPGNIGLRSADGPVLLDFATARVADGAPIEEGTAEFAGPFRHADPLLDVRCLAATALFVLGSPDRWDQARNRVREELRSFIGRCDASSDGGLAELSTILSGDQRPSSRYETATTPGQVALGSGPPVTRSFGSPPTERPQDPFVANSLVAHRSFIALAGVLGLLILAITGGEFSGTGSTSAEDPAPSERTSLQQSASETVEQHGARWNTSTGVMSIGDAREERLGVGQPGDVAAIADWSCDGRPTIGVYRPSSGAWFTFDSWETDARSSEPTMLTSGAELFVEEDPNRCATPVVR